MRRNKTSFLVSAAFLCLLLLTGAHAWAANTLRVESFAGSPGETKQVAVLLANPDTTVGALQFAVRYNSEQLSVTGVSPAELWWEPAAGIVRAVVLDTLGTGVLDPSSTARAVAYISFNINALPTAGSPDTLKLEEVVLSDVWGEPLGVNLIDGVFGNSLDVLHARGFPEETISVPVFLANADTIGGLQFALKYDTSWLTFDRLELARAGLPEPWTYVPQPGELRVVILDTIQTAQNIVQPPVGAYGDTLVKVYFSVNVGALADTIQVPLRLSDVVVSDVRGNSLRMGTEDGLFTVIPRGQIEVSPDIVEFGDVRVGTSVQDTLTIKNVGVLRSELIVTGLLLETDFSIVSAPVLPDTLEKDESVKVVLEFTPSDTGMISDMLTVVSNTLNVEKRNLPVPLTGRGIAPEIELSTTELDFGEVGIGFPESKTFQVRNVGQIPLRVDSVKVTLAGWVKHYFDKGGQEVTEQEYNSLPASEKGEIVSEHVSEYSIVSTPTSGTVAPGDSLGITVQFAPSVPGTVTGQVTVWSNDADEPELTVSLTGTGKVIAPPPTAEFSFAFVGKPTADFTASPDSGLAPLEVGFTDNSADNYQVTFTNTSSGMITSYSWDFGDGSPVSVDANPTHTYSPDVFPKSYTVKLSAIGPGGTGASEKTVTFSALSYAWDFGDSGMSTEANPTHMYTAVGTFTASLTVTGTGDRTSDPATKTIKITQPPNVLTGITVDPATGKIKTGETLQFRATGTYSRYGQVDPVLVDVTSQATWSSSADTIATIGANGLATAVDTGQVEIVATLEAFSDTARLTVVPVGYPQIALSFTSLDFGNVRVDSSRDRSFQIRSVGTLSLRVDSVKVTEGAAYSIVSTPTSGTVAPNDNLPVTVRFTPSAEGTATGQVTVWSNDAGAPVRTVSLTGTGVVPDISVQDMLAFGYVKKDRSAERTLPIRNVGTDTLVVSQVSIDLPDTFRVVGLSVEGMGVTLPAKVAPGASLDALIRFSPPDTLDYSATVTIESDDPDEPYVGVMLTGTGGLPHIGISPDTLTFPAIRVEQEVRRDLVISNTGWVDLDSVRVESSDRTVFRPEYMFDGGVTISGRSSITVPVYFTPKQAIKYETDSLTVYSDDPDHPDTTIALFGEGTPKVVPPPAPKPTAAFEVNVSKPVAGFTVSEASGPAPLTVQFTNTSTDFVVAFTNTSANATSYSWDFGDNTTSTEASPTHSYAGPGPYTVKLTATGAGGSHTAESTVTLAALTYAWAFGDDGTSTDTDPAHEYRTVGTFTASLTATGTGGASDPATKTITVTRPAPKLESVAVAPASASVLIGESTDFKATATYKVYRTNAWEDSTADVTTKAMWASTDPDVASVAVVDGSARATGKKGGTCQIKATLDEKSGAADLTVVPLTKITVSTTTPKIDKGDTATFAAIGTYENEATRDITAIAEWSSDPEGFVEIVEPGKVVGKKATQRVAILASLYGVSGSASLEIVGLASIAVSPATAKILVGDDVPFRAEGTYTDGGARDITAAVTWSSSDDAVATVGEKTGLATGVGKGTATIRATMPGEPDVPAGTATLNVMALSVVTVDPETATIPKGQTQQFTASAVYSTDGIDSTRTFAPTEVKWVSSNPAVATIDENGLATAVDTGRVTITATFQEVTGEATLIVRLELTKIVVEPEEATIPVGLSQGFKATGTFGDGTSGDITKAVTWSSSDETIATIGADGVANGLQVGEVTIAAELADQKSTATLNVAPAIPVSIEIAEGDTTIPLGMTVRYTAIATLSDPDGTKKEVTEEAIWSSSERFVADVDKGLVTSRTKGATEITAKINRQLYRLMTEDVVSDPRRVTVGAAGVVSVAVSPEAPEVTAGLTQQFTAEATYTDKSVKDVTGIAEWTSSDTTVATIKPGGLATAKAVGKTEIIAKVDTAKGSQILTVTPPTLVELAVSPGDTTVVLAINATIQYSALGTYTDRTTKPIEEGVSWSSSVDSVAKVDATGLVTLEKVGTTEITAKVMVDGKELSASSKLIVTMAKLTSISITPKDTTIEFGASQQFTAMGTFGTVVEDITTSVMWTSSVDTVAKMSAETRGLAASTGVGETTIRAALGDVSAETKLTVRPASIAVTPKSPVIGKNAPLNMVQFKAMALSGDGKQQQDATARAKWVSSNKEVAFFAVGSTVWGKAGGITEITAELLGVTSAPVVLSVDATAPNILGRPSAVGVDTSTAVVSWVTDEKSTSIVRYGIESAEEKSVLDTAKVTEHSVVLEGLLVNTRYFYQVKSADRFGNESAFTDPDTFRTPEAPDVLPPQFVVLPAVTPADSSASIGWEADELSAGEVQYGLTSAYELGAVEDPSFATAHTVTLSGLEPLTTYHFRVVVWDRKREVTGETASKDRTFATLATPDTVAPKILSGPAVVAVDSSSATIGWLTNEAGDSRVEYGLTKTLGLLKEGPKNVTEHSVTLSNLTVATKYFYRVGTMDPVENGPTYSAIDTFRTAVVRDTVKPTIVSGPNLLATTDNSATIAYDTDEPTDTKVEYGLSSGLGLVAGAAGNVRIHSVTLTNLKPDTTYFYRVVATDLAGNVTATKPFSFPTKAAPDTLSPNITEGPTVEAQDVSATITWRTNEPSSSQIVYREAGSPAEVSVGNPAPVAEHRITLVSLSSDTPYNYRVISEDMSGNRMERSGYGFKTLKTPDIKPPDISGEGVTPLPNGALIIWLTDEPATGIVRYGFSRDALVFEKTDLSLSTFRSVMLTDLKPGTVYYYKLVSVDAAGNRREIRLSPDWFKTLEIAVADVTPPVIIEGPVVPYRADTRAVIAWVTDEKSDSRVFYRPVGAASYSFFITSREMTQYHSLTITDLEPDTGYEFVIVSVDASRNPVVYPEGVGISLKVIRQYLHDNYALAKVLQLGGGLSFETLLEPDTQWPVITSGPTIVANTTGSGARVTIEWTTDESSDSEVEFGVSEAGGGAAAKVIGTFAQEAPSLEFRSASGEDVTVHRMVLAGLQTGTPYLFRVGSTDPSDNGATYSLPSVFMTAVEADVEPPILSDVEVVAITDRQATVLWKTDEVSDSKVKFGLSSEDLTEVRVDPTDVTDHKVTLTNLAAATTYYYRVRSVDFSDNPAVGDILEFTTSEAPDLVPPTISEVAVTTTGPTTALLTWRTDEIADSYVEYGPDASLGLRVESLTDVIEHAVTLVNLEPNQEVYYRVGSIDRAGNGPAWSDKMTFIPVADVEAPAAPTGLEVVAGNERVFLKWQPNVEPDLAGYDVYRSAAGAAFERIAAMVTVPTYTDPSVENDVEYTYYVTALDKLIPKPNVSEASAEVSAIASEVNVPGPPSEVDPTLVWQSNVEDGVRISLTTRPWLVVQAPTELGASLPEAELTFSFVIATDPSFEDVLAASTPDQVFDKDQLELYGIVTPSQVGKDWFGWQVPSNILDVGDVYWWRVRAKKGGILNGLWMEAAPIVVSQEAAVELTTFTGYEDRGDAVIEWVIAREYGHAGFNLYRSTTENGTYRKITPELITGGNPYRYRDETVKPDRTYYYKLEAVDLSGFGQVFGPVAVRVSAPAAYSLAQNYPNPFNPETAIEYALPKAGEVTLKIYNLAGQEVVTLVHGRMDAGHHSVRWDGRDRNGVEMASGIYFYRIKTGAFMKTRKMVLVK